MLNLCSLYIYYLYLYFKQRKDRKYESPDHQLIPPWITRKRRYCDFAPISKIPASAVQNTVIAKMRRERKVTPINVNRGNNAGKQINVKLSKFFETISTLYKECPLDQFDEWRSYSYFIVSRRLRQLDFEVDSDPIALQRLSQVIGFGSKIMKQVCYRLFLHFPGAHISFNP